MYSINDCICFPLSRMHPGILGVHFGSNVFLLIVLVNINAMYCHVLFLHHFQINFNTSGFVKRHLIISFYSLSLFFHNSVGKPDVVHLLKLRFNLGDTASSRGHLHSLIGDFFQGAHAQRWHGGRHIGAAFQQG